MIEPLSEDLLDLLRRRVGSLEALECLLLVRRERERKWASFEIARELGIPEGMVDTTLAAMKAAALVVREGAAGGATWRYAPRGAELEAIVDRLARVYEERRLEVMRILSAQAMERLRSSAARAFADAFVIGRKKDG